MRPRRETTERYQQPADADRGTVGESTAHGLGYFGIGPGVAEPLAPDVVARIIGVRNPGGRSRSTLRLTGLRQIGSGTSSRSRSSATGARAGRRRHAPAGSFGYAHLTGGFAGGQAECARAPFADFGPLTVPEGMTDEPVLFLSDIPPTGYMGAEMCGIQPGDTVAVWGCGPVGLFAIASAYMLGAGKVIADRPLPLPSADGQRASRRGDRQLRRGGQRSRRAGRPHRRPDHCVG